MCATITYRQEFFMTDEVLAELVRAKYNIPASSRIDIDKNREGYTITASQDVKVDPSKASHIAPFLSSIEENRPS